ncbi:hypothetical protein [Spirosoma sp. KUDC1026]|uniref:hypothetical protein n=1 Tax=Spirosoma sp. KUDC1026 TaxID=2745947 RepID=UPI00159B9E60|nr:hypothetical protein [Spirosoma sp. KUDC1026]QKZ11245.1 hypothetical protein HU175_00765 [Spirosoma sp. KUDC1026]
MNYTLSLFSVVVCLFAASCQRPVAYFQPTARAAASRLPVDAYKPGADSAVLVADVQEETLPETITGEGSAEPVTVSRKSVPQQTTGHRIEQRVQRIEKLLTESRQERTTQQPRPKPQKKLKLGNRIRQSLGMPLRQELNWWQRISWKLKASVIVILIAVLFAILHITLLAVIFGLVGAFLLLSGLRRSFKVRRPWF